MLDFMEQDGSWLWGHASRTEAVSLTHRSLPLLSQSMDLYVYCDKNQRNEVLNGLVHVPSMQNSWTPSVAPPETPLLLQTLNVG